MNRWFARFSDWTAEAMGTPIAFALAVGVVVVWALFGPYFGWSDTHQLIINTGTTIVTFWMIFLVQHTQNRDTKAMQKKLDELILSQEGPRDEVAGIEREDEG